MAVEFLWHNHHIQLRSVLSDAGARCFMCLLPVSGYNYRCDKCTFFLHISCLQLPVESLHPLHQHHHLTLLEAPPSNNNGTSEILCNDCGNSCSGFTYHCPAACQFNLHLHCALKGRAVKREIHKHPLVFFASPSGGDKSFRCYVCGDLGYGFNLRCQACEIFLHVECSELPVTVKSEIHEHPFILTPTRSIDGNSDEAYCDFCEEEANLSGCVYFCVGCSYTAHLGCVTSVSKPHMKLSYRDADCSSMETSDLAKLETKQSEFVDPFKLQANPRDDDEITRLRRRYNEHRILELGNSDCSTSEPQTGIGHSFDEGKFQLNQTFDETELQTKHNVVELQHFSHQHPLTLSDEHKNDKVHCIGCWRNVSGSAYCCTQCKFFLHRWCGDLPRKIKHPLHPIHSLTLLESATALHWPQCDACGNPCDDFTFSCSHRDFNLHLECASIPSTLRSEIHQHHLTSVLTRPYSTWCKACGNNIVGATFQCKECDFDLDFNCALLPHKVRHRCHLHPLTLTSSLVEDDSDEYYCDCCEEERDPKHWVYYCAECGYIAHISCVTSELFDGVQSQGLLQYDHHAHLLNLITKSPFNSV